MGQIFVFTVFLALIGESAFAASVFKRALEGKQHKYIDSGTIIGGEAGQAFSLLKLRAQADRKRGIERIVLNLGDEQGQLLKGKMSFFQVNMDPSAMRLVINLSQVVASTMSEAELKDAFKSSPFVRSVALVKDPSSQSLSLVLSLKQKAKAEVFQLTKQNSPGRLVIDLAKK